MIDNRSIIRKYTTKAIRLLMVLLMTAVLLVTLALISKTFPGLPRIISYIIESKIPGIESNIGNAEILLNLSQRKISCKLREIRIDYANRYLINIEEIVLVANLSDLLLLKFDQIPKKIIFSPEIEVLKIHGPKTKEEAEDEEYAQELRYYITHYADLTALVAKSLIGVTFNIATATRSLPVSVSIEDIRIDTDTVENLKLMLHISLLVNERTVELDSVLDASGEHATFSGIWKKLPITIMDELLLEKNFLVEQNILSGDMTVDVEFEAHGCDIDGCTALQFEVIGHEGIIEHDENLMTDLEFKDVRAKGYCRDNCNVFALEELYLNAPELELEGSIHKDRDGLVLITATTLSSLSVAQIYDLWPDAQLPEVKEWLIAHLRNGTIESASMHLKLDVPALMDGQEIQKDDLDISIDASDIKLFYMSPDSTAQPLEIKRGSLAISAHDIQINPHQSSLSLHEGKSLAGYIDFYADHPVVMVEGTFSGPAHDLLSIALSHSFVQDMNINILNGNAQTSLSLNIPIEDELIMSPDIIKLSSTLTNIELDEVVPGYKVHQGQYDLTLDGSMLQVKGRGLVNGHLPVQVYVERDVEQLESAKINLAAESDVSNFRKAGLAVPDFVANKMRVTADIHYLSDKTLTNIEADLKDSTLSIESIGLHKEANVASSLKVLLAKHDANKDIDIASYSLDIEDINSTGHGMLARENFGVLALSSDKTNMGRTKCAFQYMNNHGHKNLKIRGAFLDLSKVNFIALFKDLKSANETTQHGSFNLQTSLKYIALKNNQLLAAPVFEISCSDGKCIKAKIMGTFQDGSKINVFYDFPVLSIVSDSAEHTLLALGINKSVRKGTLELKGKFSDHSKFHGELYMYHYRTQGSPILSALLTVGAVASTSFLGAADMISGKGIPFSEWFSDISYDNGILRVNKFSAHGSVISLEGVGFIDTRDGFLEAKGIMAPANLVNSFARKIPLIGIILAGGKDRDVIYTNFDVKGTAEGELKVHVNPFSTFIPGALDRLFNGKDSDNLEQMIDARRKANTCKPQSFSSTK